MTRKTPLLCRCRLKGGITLKDMRFGYIPEETVLDNVSLDIAPQSTVALVGPTGVGKTTLAGLIPRFYDVDEGSICIDGIDIRRLATTISAHKSASCYKTSFSFTARC